MKSYQKKISIVLTFIILTISLIPSTTATRTIGIGPSIIDFSDVFRFGEYQRTIFIYNGNEYESNFSLLVSGDIDGWVTFYETLDSIDPITSLIVAPETTTPIIMKLSIPKDASNGAYAGEVYTEFYPTNVTQENTTTAGVILRLPAIINLYVSGTQNLNATVSRVSFMETEINYLLPVAIDIKNTGNVVATPSVNITITKKGVYVDQYSGKLSSVQPGSTRYNTLSWNTSGNIPGTYDANVIIFLGEKTILHDQYSFELLAPGTLTRNGTLSNLAISGNPTQNGIIKIEASFVNTGEIETKAKFIGEVYRDGILLHTLESEELQVSRYSDRMLTTYYRFGSDPGTYLIKGYVLYEGKETNIESISVPIGVLSLASLLPYIAIVVVLISAFIISFMIIKKRRDFRVSPRYLKRTKPVKRKQKKTISSAPYLPKTKKHARKVAASSKKTSKQKRMRSKPSDGNQMNADEVERFLDSIESPTLFMKKAKKRTSRK